MKARQLGVLVVSGKTKYRSSTGVIIYFRESTLRVSVVAMGGAHLSAGWRLMHQGAQLLLTQLQKFVYWWKAG